MRNLMLAASLLAIALFFAACGERPDSAGPFSTGDPVEEPATAPADAFMARIAEHCGEAFAGQIVANHPPVEDDPFVGKQLVMHVRKCSEGEIEIPFHVGDDHSRTWVLTRTESGLRLKHDHRHEDGTDDAVTMYGGDTATPGTEVRQEFPVDQESIDLFLREGLTVSVTNVWAMEIEPRQRFLYELTRREHDRVFQVEFDLTSPVPPPPTPWGHPELEGAPPPDGDQP
jgi:hypothetical protein